MGTRLHYGMEWEPGFTTGWNGNQAPLRDGMGTRLHYGMEWEPGSTTGWNGNQASLRDGMGTRLHYGMEWEPGSTTGWNGNQAPLWDGMGTRLHYGMEWEPGFTTGWKGNQAGLNGGILEDSKQSRSGLHVPIPQVYLNVWTPVHNRWCVYTAHGSSSITSCTHTIMHCQHNTCPHCRIQAIIISTHTPGYS